MKQIDTIVLVRDIKSSKKFYLEVMGLEVLHDWESMVVFKNRLALHQGDLLQPRELAKSFVDIGSIGFSNLIIYIGTKTIESEYSRLKEMDVEFIHGIVELPWQRIFRMKDNSGYTVEIGEEKDT